MKSDQVLFAERVPDCGQVQDSWREVMKINFFFFWPLSGTFVRIYDIELRDHFKGSQVARCALVVKAINGLILPYCCCFCSTGEDSQKVKTWSGCTSLIYSAHALMEKSAGWGREGVAHCAQLTSKCHEGGGTSLPWKPAPEVFDFDQLWCSDQSCARLFLPGEGSKLK